LKNRENRFPKDITIDNCIRIVADNLFEIFEDKFVANDDSNSFYIKDGNAKSKKKRKKLFSTKIFQMFHNNFQKSYKFSKKVINFLKSY